MIRLEELSQTFVACAPRAHPIRHTVGRPLTEWRGRPNTMMMMR
jgi:hypothetical protein